MCPGASSIVSGSTTSAQPGDETAAPRVEDATSRRVGGARDLPAQRDSGPHLAVHARHRRQQGLGVRVVGTVEDLLVVPNSMMRPRYMTAMRSLR